MVLSYSFFYPNYCVLLHPFFSEAQSWRKRNMTHQCSHERTPASAHASAHASVHESAHKSWLSLCYNPIQRLPLNCSRECSRGCPRKCTRSGLVVCHLVCFHLPCSFPISCHAMSLVSAWKDGGRSILLTCGA